jgi:hypothetical protein
MLAHPPWGENSVEGDGEFLVVSHEQEWAGFYLGFLVWGEAQAVHSEY